MFWHLHVNSSEHRRSFTTSLCEGKTLALHMKSIEKQESWWELFTLPLWPFRIHLIKSTKHWGNTSCAVKTFHEWYSQCHYQPIVLINNIEWVPRISPGAKHEEFPRFTACWILERLASTLHPLLKSIGNQLWNKVFWILVLGNVIGNLFFGIWEHWTYLKWEHWTYLIRTMCLEILPQSAFQEFHMTSMLTIAVDPKSCC